LLEQFLAPAGSIDLVRLPCLTEVYRECQSASNQRRPSPLDLSKWIERRESIASDRRSPQKSRDFALNLRVNLACSRQKTVVWPVFPRFCRIYGLFFSEYRYLITAFRTRRAD